jgi:hypothetical protein
MLRLWAWMPMMLLFVTPASSQDIHSVQVDRNLEKLVVKGIDLDLVSSITLGGVSVVASAPVAPNLMEIPFSEPIYSAVQWPGNYNLIVDGSVRLSVYIDAPITPPPGPPTGGPDCACVPGWEANASLIADNWAFCQPISDGSQIGYVGSSTTAIYPGPTPWLAATAYDSENPTAFDYGNPGAALSFCALDVNIDGTYEVAEPVTNIDQYNDCVNWLFREGVCL